MRRLIAALGAGGVALSLAGCPDDPDDGIFPDRDPIPEPTLDQEPYPAPGDDERDRPYGVQEPAEVEEPGPGAFERTGERLDEAADETGEVLRDGAEEAGDAAGQAGEWVEEQTDDLGR